MFPYAYLLFVLLRRLNIIKILKSVYYLFKSLGPSIADITNQYQKVIKPFIETPFIPQEVDSLAEKNKKVYQDVSMTNAILVGPKEKSSGLNEVSN